MASIKEANLAREQYSDLISKLGAHSIGVDEVKGKEGFAVIAYFEKEPSKKIPETLEVKSGNRTVEVPLVVRLMQMPSPE